MNFLSMDEDLKGLLGRARRVVVLGASRNQARPGYFVPAYLLARGFDVVGVRPSPETEPWMGRLPVTSLDAAGGPIDILLVFRRSDVVPEYLDAMVAAQPSVVWFQEGSFHEHAAHRLQEQGLAVVGPRCILAEHQRLIGGPIE